MDTLDWIRGKRLGHGSFAAVNLAIPMGQSSSLPQLMAVKSCGVSQSGYLMNEKLILEELQDCPEIIRCFGESFSCENGEKLYNVLLEYASGGSMADKLRDSGDRSLPEFEVRRYTKALLKGLNYIHKFGYVHCDIKLQNILLGPDGGLRIADFGLAKRAGCGGGSACEIRGTPMYMSPEVVSGGDQGAAADVWALGCTVAEMAGGSPAWPCSDVAALLMRIGAGDESPEIPGVLSDEGKDFLKKCFVKDPRERWTAEMLLRHPFVVSVVESDGDCVDTSRSISPRCPFDFPDWISTATCSITSLPSPELGSYSSDVSGFRKVSSERLRELISIESPDWSVTDEWVAVR